MSNLIKILNPATSRLALLLTRALRSVTTTLLLLSAWSTTSTTFAATIPAPYELATWRGFSASAVSYTFDDNSPNQFSVAQPMFDAKGLHATFFCIVGGTPDWTAITNASAKGHEIGNHTLTHPNLSSETDAQVIAEEGGAKTLIEAHTGKKCVSLAYPYCAPPNELITSQFCSFARSCNGSLVPITPSDFLSIGSMGPDVDMNAASENAASSGSWLVWLIHGIDNDAACCPIASSVLKANLDYVSTFPDDWWIETFGNVCRYIQERNAAVLTVVSIDAAHITIQLTHNLDNTIFNYPLTLRRPMPSGWATAAVTQNGVSVPSHVVNGKLMFDVVPNGGDIVMSNPNAPQGQTTNIGADDPNIQYVGRFDRTTPTAPGFDWSLSTIRAKFQGTSCSVKLDGNRKFFDVFIDGVKTTTPIISVSSGLETFQVATGLSNTVHSVSICRRTEGANGKNTFQGFVLDSGKALVSPDPGPIRKIAFIGDSYTCGYGDEAPSVEAPAADANENACITYAALMARHYNADCMITAWSGKGMVRNYGDANQTSPDPLPTVYPRTCASVASNDYAFDWQPDVVVIALGINDFSTTPHPSEQQFVGGYVSFIQTLRSHYPKAHILCTYWTNMDPVGSGYIAEAASASGDSKVHFANVNCPLNYPADYGSNWHPNASGHTKIANAFIPVFDSIMGPTWGKSIYAFEGNSLDTSGNGNDGTANALTYVPGKIGAQAAQFNGTSSNVSIPRSVTDDFTVAMWVKTTDTAGSAGGQWWSGKGLVDGEVWGGAADWGTSIVNGQFVLGVGSSSGDVTVASAVNINDGAWHHVAATRNNTSGAMQVYVDGILRGSGTGPTGSRTAPPNLSIGSIQVGLNFLNGTLDDVRLYDRVLSSSDVALLAAGELPAPQNVTATSGSGKITLSWNAVNGAADYTIRRSGSSGGPYTELAAGISATTYVNSGLADGTTWYYTVAANGFYGLGTASAPVSATTDTAAQNWRLNYFGTTANSGNAADSADPDGDGMTNAQEFAAGTNPNDRSSVLKVSQMQVSGNNMLISFQTVSGKSYRVDRNDTLQSNSWVTVLDNIAGTGGTVQVTDSGGAAPPRRFYRVVLK